MRLFYSSDIHGSEQCWRKFLNAAAFYDADLLILGGDITGKVLVPLVEEEPGHYLAQVFGRTEKARKERDVEALEKRIRFNGFYPYRCSREDYARLSTDDGYRDQVMNEVMLAEVKRWMQIADEKLAGSGVRCLVMAGNDDPWAIDAAIGSAAVENPDGRVVRVEDYQVLSSSWANPTPWDSPREADEDRLCAMYRDLGHQLEPGVPAIFNLHVPPFDTGLDTAAELDDQLSVRRTGGQAHMVPVGSRAARDFIEREQPILGLHGHIHESRFIAKLGETVCINPGSNYSDGVIDGAIVDLEGGRVTQYQLVRG
jgi:Icc-related predicted phosphoesterase